MSSGDDEDGNSSNIILEPIDADVLCGRGRAIRTHPGNQLYISLIQDKKLEYTEAAKGWKQEIVREVVGVVRNKNGRFLQRQGNHWVDIGEHKALAKTAQAFRDFKEDDENKVTSTKPTVSLVTKKKKPNGLPSFLGRYGVVMKPKLAGQGRKVDTPSSSSSSSSEESGSESDDDNDDKSSASSDSSKPNDDDAGDVSETETEDSFPVYRGG